jgi:hypothetical protein
LISDSAVDGAAVRRREGHACSGILAVSSAPAAEFFAVCSQKIKQGLSTKILDSIPMAAIRMRQILPIAHGIPNGGRRWRPLKLRASVCVRIL